MQYTKIRQLKGKRIVILGGTSGIGLATASAAAQEGADIIVVSHNQNRVNQALAILPQDTQGFAIDLTNEHQISELFKTIGLFDHLVFTAGDALQFSELMTLDMNQAKQSFDLRFWGAVMAVKYGAPLIRQGGSVILTTGALGRKPRKGSMIISSMAGAIEGLARALSVSLAPIRVNAVCPGTIRTGLLKNLTENEREAFFQEVGNKLLIGRVGETDEAAEAYLYLMKGGFTTGQVLVVDGGSLLV